VDHRPRRCKFGKPLALCEKVLTRYSSVRTGLQGSALSSAGGRRLLVSLLAGLMLAALTAVHPIAPTHTHISAIPAAGPGWLDRLNQWRLSAGLLPLTENSTYSAGDVAHATYMVQTGQVTHGESTAYPQYTAAGDLAAQNSNIFVSSSTSTTDEQSIDWWMAAPFHAMALMDPRLTTTGFGSYRNTAYSPWKMGAGVNTGQGMTAPGLYPVFYPGNGATEPLTAYSGNESPDPTSACPGYTGLPLFIEVGANVATAAGAVHTLTGNGASLTHCVIDSSNAAFTSYLKWRGGVIVFPQAPLQSGVTYAVSLTVNGLPYAWSFKVGPLVAEPSSWESLGGKITSSPAIASSSSTASDVFVRGADNALWHRSWNGTTWGSWDSLGGIITSDPSTLSEGPNQIDVFVTGADRAIWHRGRNGTTWSPWESVGGIATSAPDAASWGMGRLDVVVRGADNGLWHRSWNGASWGSWDNVGGLASANPSLVAAGNGRIDLFVRGLDNAIWHRSGNGAGTWSAWETMGGIVTSGPASSSCAAGHLDLFVLGTDASLWQRGYNGTSWGGWQLVGGRWSADPGASCRPSTTIVDLVERGPDWGLWHSTATGS
jgi:hypothetical protein